jgi:hypothetical protein
MHLYDNQGIVMGKEYTEISERLQEWIAQQHMFFVSTAPTAADGLVNCSPKGLDCLRVLSPHKIAYVDTGGSGIETVAHLKDTGRITADAVRIRRSAENFLSWPIGKSELRGTSSYVGLLEFLR